MPGISKRFDKIIPLIALPVLLLSAVVQVKFSIEGDKGWLMFAASEWVDGKKLSVDIFEVNPPLIIWIYSIPAWFAKHFAFIKDYQAHGILGIMFTALAIGLSMRLIARHPAFAEDSDLRLEFGLLLSAVLLFIINTTYFFDREHIMLTFSMPYILRFMPSLARVTYPLPMRLIIGLLAGVGFSIKPHATLVFAALQLIYLFRERSPFILGSVENIIIYLFGAVYCAAIFKFAPEYLTTVLPMAYSIYWGYNVKGTIRTYLPMILLISVIPLLDFRLRFTTPFRRDIYYFILLGFIYMGYALINNGWGYTYQPLLSTITFTTGWVLWEYLWLKRQHVTRSLPFHQFDVGIRGSLCCLAFQGLMGIFTIHNGLNSEMDCGGYRGFCKWNEPFTTAIREKHIHSFGVMSGEFTRWPLISRESGARWDTRFNHLWMVPGLMHDQTNKDAPERWTKDQWILTYVGKAFASDIYQRKPEAMFVDSSDEFFTYGKPVDTLALLSAVPEFKEAWRHYHYDSSINHCKSKVPDSQQTVGCKYDIYLWKD